MQAVVERGTWSRSLCSWSSGSWAGPVWKWGWHRQQPSCARSEAVIHRKRPTTMKDCVQLDCKAVGWKCSPVSIASTVAPSPSEGVGKFHDNGDTFAVAAHSAQP